MFIQHRLVDKKQHIRSTASLTSEMQNEADKDNEDRRSKHNKRNGKERSKINWAVTGSARRWWMVAQKLRQTFSLHSEKKSFAIHFNLHGKTYISCCHSPPQPANPFLVPSTVALMQNANTWTLAAHKKMSRNVKKTAKNNTRKKKRQQLTQKGEEEVESFNVKKNRAFCR